MKTNNQQINSKRKHTITNPAERKRVLVTISLGIIFLITAVLFINNAITGSLPMQSRSYRELYKNAASISRILFFFVIAIYPVFWLLRNKSDRVLNLIERFNLKPILRFLGKTLRQWHVPIAIIGVFIILIHVYMVLISGFMFNTKYISGLAALIVLIIQCISGVFKYKGMGRKWHISLGILFIVLMLIHG
ncbi:MAG: hypothetical protein F8N39_08025 [Clostridiaceae bacterium]|nr:hypothetical protein [Clostridiaceae bacterium]